MAKIIKGYYESGRVFVVDDGKESELLPDDRSKAVNKGSRRFYWGFDSDGAGYLATSILLQFLPEKAARAWYYEFKVNKIVSMPKADFTIKKDEVMKWYEKKMAGYIKADAYF